MLFFRKKKKKQNKEELPTADNTANQSAIDDPQISQEIAQPDLAEETSTADVADTNINEVTEGIASVTHESASSIDDGAQEISSAETLDFAENQADLDAGLEKTRSNLFSSLSGIFSSKVEFNDDLFEELEDILLAADIGVSASMEIIDALRERVKKERIKTEQDVIQCLEEETFSILSHAERPWNFNLRPYVILMVGVNGVGKTTTTAKIANYFKSQGKKVVLAAGDTFRAAAVEQLEQWGERLDIQVISQGQNADAAAVAHDAFSAALARDADVLIIDTAGRLHTQTDLMEQLEKIIRVLRKIDEDTPHEVMQVLDATTGQNALSQLKHFIDAVGVNSICLTKLDGSAKGGVALALTQQQDLPIRFVGVGEAFEDLKAFDAKAFTQALIAKKS